MTIRYGLILVVLSAVALLVAACSEDVYMGTMAPNKPPVITVTNGPFERSTVGYKVRFSWIGDDPDGRVEYYEFVICDGDPLGFDPADTTGIEKWHRTSLTDSVFKFTADEFDTNLVIGTGTYSRYKKTHTFFVRAVDDRGGRSEPAFRSFTAFTYAPYVVIDSPTNPFPGQTQTLPPVTKFRWHGEDPIDTPNKIQGVDSIRYLLTTYTSSTVQQLNQHPEWFESQWRPWVSYGAPGDTGTSTVIGDDELLNRQFMYIFAIQAKDEAGAVTSVYSLKNNARAFTIFTVAGPRLQVSEPYLGTFTVIGANNRSQVFSFPAGFVFNFSWNADASSYGGTVTSYRYGWDVIDFNDPSDWAVEPSPLVKSAPPKSFVSGIHTLSVEAVDNNGVSTLAQIEIDVFTIDMTRNLLWVDDFYSDDFVQTDYGFPTESEHDAFWLHVCSRAAGFQPGRDVFDTREANLKPPDMKLVWQYKNIIWTYSSSSEVNSWDNVVRFIPESRLAYVFPLPFNYLAYYIASGGHLWTCGKSDRSGGLYAVFYTDWLVSPLYLKCEITGPRTGCEGDTSGVFCMAYKDYCVSVLDKAQARPRDDPRMPTRRVDWDAMAYGVRDASDAVTKKHPELPPKLELWSQVTKPGMMFDPQVQGFTYVELYNPGYWMGAIGVKAQSCFHPMYRMRARNTNSVVDNVPVAFWTTKYANVVAPVSGAVGAPSVHFGIPLWFFNRAQVDSIADVVFDTWGIKGSP
jgi:hypothetical protein